MKNIIKKVKEKYDNFVSSEWCLIIIGIITIVLISILDVVQLYYIKKTIYGRGLF